MSKLNVCLELSAEEAGECSRFEMENFYQKILKPLLTYLYYHPKVCLIFSFNGRQISWIKENHSEAIEVLKDLTSRQQVELLGGGYHSPIFPLLFPVDRSAQIESMTSILKDTVGKRPYGMSLFGSIWDPSLITTFQSCGMEYVVLDSTLVPSSKTSYVPVITNDQGRNIKVISSYKNLVPLKNESFSSWKDRVLKIHKNNSCDEVCVIPFSITSFNFFMENNVINRDFFNGVEESAENESSELNFTTAKKFIKSAKNFIQSYVPAGMDWEIAQWAKKAFVKSENKSHFPITIYDYLNTYPQNRKLYERMMFISMLINQNKGGDKMRKKTAREYLHSAQCGYNYVKIPEGFPAVAKNRQNSYGTLNMAEKKLREGNEFCETVSCFDYNNDGLNEYVCQMENYHAVVSLKGGCVEAFETYRCGGNYAANLSRINQFDKVDDSYTRGFFTEHFLSDEEFKIYLKQQTCSSRIFCNQLFEEKKFDPKRRDLLLEIKSEYLPGNLPVALRKKYSFSSSGMIVQYILKNESPFELKGNFICELNFSQTDFLLAKQYLIELISRDNRQFLEKEDFNCGKGVSLVQITDSAEKTAFIIEPNEECGFSCRNISFNRPISENEISQTSRTLVSSFYWSINLAPGMEMEKTLNFSSISSKKLNSKN